MSSLTSIVVVLACLVAVLCGSAMAIAPVPVVPIRSSALFTTARKSMPDFRALSERAPPTESSAKAAGGDKCKSGHECPAFIESAVCCKGGEFCCPNKCHVYRDGRISCDEADKSVEKSKIEELDRKIAAAKQKLAEFRAKLQAAQEKREAALRAKASSDEKALGESSAEAKSTKEALTKCEKDNLAPKLGLSREQPAVSCQELYKAGNRKSGVYWFNIGNNIPVFQAYCDQEQQGGGWMLIHKNHQSGNQDVTDSGVNEDFLRSPEMDRPALYPASILRALDRELNAEFQVRITSGFKTGSILSWIGLPYYTTDNHRGTRFAPWARWRSNENAAWRTPEFGAWGGHALCLGNRFAWGPTDEHICIKRFAGHPTVGYWLNGGEYVNHGYAASFGTGWVRWT